MYAFAVIRIHEDLPELPVTIQDIAKKLNISTATVSRVLNKKASALVSDATKREVLETAEEMGYHVNRAARALVTGRHNNVALLLPNLWEPCYTSAVRYVEQQIRGSGYGIMIGELGVADWRDWPVDVVLGWDIMGGIISLEQLGDMRSTNLVSLGVFYSPDADYVGIDIRPGVREAVQLMVSSGRSRIAYLTTKPMMFEGESRRDEYLGVLAEAGLQPEVIISEWHLRRETRDSIQRYVADHGCPDGILCMNDDMAIGAYRGLRDMGIQAPEEVWLVGCDGIEDAEYLDSPISTIVSPVEETCRLAWEFARNRLDNPELPLQGHILRAPLELRTVPRWAGTPERDNKGGDVY